MTNESNKQQAQQDQTQPKQQGRNNPTGSVNPADKSRTNPPQEGGIDPKNRTLNAGVKTSARGGDDYYPAVSAERLKEIDAMIVTHAHEDHLAAVGWCIERGFSGRMLMTDETRGEAEPCLQAYATAELYEWLLKQSVK